MCFVCLCVGYLVALLVDWLANWLTVTIVALNCNCCGQSHTQRLCNVSLHSQANRHINTMTISNDDLMKKNWRCNAKGYKNRVIYLKLLRCFKADNLATIAICLWHTLHNDVVLDFTCILAEPGVLRYSFRFICIFFQK